MSTVPNYTDKDGGVHEFVPENGPDDLKDCPTCSFGDDHTKHCPLTPDSADLHCTESCGNWRKVS